MKKFKFNYKLTLFLVGLFVSFLFIFLSGKFEICRSFGLIGLGLSMFLYLFWRDDVVKKAINKLDKKIEYVEDGYYPLEEDIDLEDADQELLQPLDKSEKEYVMLELSIKRQNILKNDKKVKILFALSGLAFIICGFMLMG